MREYAASTKPEEHPMKDPTDLSPQECARLLGAGVAGRVALSAPDGPHIIPVNYSVVDAAVILRTSPYSVLGTHGRDSLLAFEVDTFDYERHTGWSVVARGRAEVLTDAAEVAHVRETWEPRQWAGGQRGLYLRLRWTEISGRSVGAVDNIAATLPVSRTL
jgi:nitroimidazol reductase NimA-like FMN-containing flavoprotein (pyridoxamine 5'-phosphate oxidase superfamily)